MTTESAAMAETITFYPDGTLSKFGFEEGDILIHLADETPASEYASG